MRKYLYAIAFLLLLPAAAPAQFSGCPGGFCTPRPADAPAAGLVLDGIATGIKTAYSTRKLRTAYAGSALRVERTSDSTQQDVGFASNVLDTSSLGTFCSATTCKVVTWYDQSGAGFDITQATIAQAPVIYQAGAVNAINTRPAILFTRSDNTVLSNAGASPNSVDTLWQNAIISFDTSIGEEAITGGPAGGLEFRIDQGSGNPHFIRQATSDIGGASSGISTTTGVIVEGQYNHTSGNYSFWINGSAAGTGTTAATYLNSTPFTLGNGSTSGFEGSQGSIGEYIAYDLAGGIPGASQSAIIANQKVYWGTP
jgi:hypothetical protein